MVEPADDAGDHEAHVSLWLKRSGFVLCVSLLVAGFYLLTEHTAHVFEALPLVQLFMHHDNAPAYEIWMLIILNSAVFIFFAFSFGKLRTPRGGRSFSAFSAFIMALLAELCVHLTHTEKAEAQLDFGAENGRYAAEVRAWFPRLGGHASANRPSGG